MSASRAGQADHPWRLTKETPPPLDGLTSSICVVHQSHGHIHPPTPSHATTMHGSTDQSFHSQRCLQTTTKELLIKSESAQSLQLWNLLPLKKIMNIKPPWVNMSLCHGDKHLAERAVNILTSIPFVVVGIQAPRDRFATKLFANSVVGVGVVAGFYHSAKGETRKFLRWSDHVMIATSTLLLSRALRKSNDWSALYISSAAALPTNPRLVSALHVGLLEVTFARRALAEPQLRRAHTLHTISALVGCAFFIADDVFPETPYLHAAWHVAAAIGTATCFKLLQ